MERYFKLHDEIKEALRKSDYASVARLSIASLDLIPALVHHTKKEYGTFDILESVAIHTGGRVLAALGDIPALEKMCRTLSSVPEVRLWAADVKELIEDAQIGERILAYVNAHPGYAQSELRSVFGASGGQRLSNICYWLAKVGRIRREKRGRSYALYKP